MSMKYYEELRRVHQAICLLDKNMNEQEKEQKHNLLLAAVKKICNLAVIARKEGLLALEEAAENLTEDKCNTYLKNLIMLVVDGTEPEYVRSIGLSRYFCSGVDDYNALIYLIFLEGALAIQAGNNPRLIEEKEKALLPDTLYERYLELQEEEQKAICQETDATIIERLCKGKRLWNPNDNGYYVMKLADYTICDINDKGLQRILRDISNTELVVAMKGLSGDARRRIFDNLSERLAKMIAEDMGNIGPVRMLDVLEATQKLLAVIIRLIDRGEIVGQYEYLKPFFDMFSIDAESERSKDMRFDKLKQLVNEYEEAAKHSVC